MSDSDKNKSDAGQQRDASSRSHDSNREGRHDTRSEREDHRAERSERQEQRDRSQAHLSGGNREGRDGRGENGNRSNERTEHREHRDQRTSRANHTHLEGQHSNRPSEKPDRSGHDSPDRSQGNTPKETHHHSGSVTPLDSHATTREYLNPTNPSQKVTEHTFSDKPDSTREPGSKHQERQEQQGHHRENTTPSHNREGRHESGGKREGHAPEHGERKEQTRGQEIHSAGVNREGRQDGTNQHRTYASTVHPYDGPTIGPPSPGLISEREMHMREAQDARIRENVYANAFGALGYTIEKLRQEDTGKHDQDKLEGASGIGRIVGAAADAFGGAQQIRHEANHAASPADRSTLSRQGKTVERPKDK